MKYFYLSHIQNSQLVFGDSDVKTNLQVYFFLEHVNIMLVSRCSRLFRNCWTCLLVNAEHRRLESEILYKRYSYYRGIQQRYGFPLIYLHLQPGLVFTYNM